MRTPLAIVVVCAMCASASQLVAAPTTAYPLWDGPTPLDVRKLSEPRGIQHRTIARAVAGEYQFLHGVAIASHNGVLYASWANSPVDENSADEVLRGARSTDDGATWSPPEMIGSGFPGPLRHSHGVFLADPAGPLWALAARYGKGPGAFAGLATEAWVLTRGGGAWKGQGVVIENARPVDAPQQLPNGSWIMGIFDRDRKPGVAISAAGDFSRWTTVPLRGKADVFGDTTLVQLSDRLLAIVRNAPTASVAESRDQGRTWTQLAPSNYPMAASKAFAGRLSTGQWYLISNIHDRHHLVLAVSHPGEAALHAAWIVRRGVSEPPHFPGRAKGPQWSYPYACEHRGRLYIAYSIGKEDAGLSIIPLASLQEM
jgi:hypothetical protein